MAVDEELEEKLFEIISNVGGAKSSFIGAIQAAKVGNFEEAQKLIDEGSKMFIEGHKVHAYLIEKEMSEAGLKTSLILIHAEDQVIMADMFKTLAGEFIDAYKHIHAKK
ncbi:MAG: PTS lactose/cellobiose transporter subunit IIA [Spirochaetaceae bacterium]|jgi:PTS system cellobiose-specific IIA component|nr:PTS lactose/cellobiose transporter subunit IIA [Spirochaetaceae bacterium]